MSEKTMPAATVAAHLLPLRINVGDSRMLAGSLSWERHDTLGRQGADIAVLYECASTSQRVALVRCEAGAFSKSHLHVGHETFHVLSGTFHDDHGQYGPGDVVIYPPGSTHGWTSPTGALILAIWGGLSARLCRNLNLSLMASTCEIAIHSFIRCNDSVEEPH